MENSVIPCINQRKKNDLDKEKINDPRKKSWQCRDQTHDRTGMLLGKILLTQSSRKRKTFLHEKQHGMEEDKEKNVNRHINLFSLILNENRQ